MNRLLARGWWLLLCLLVGLGFWRLKFDADVLNLLPPDEPTVQGLKLYQAHFTNARELIISLRTPEAELAERLAAELTTHLEKQSNLVESASWQPPWLKDPGQLAELLGCLWLNQPPEIFAALTNRLAPARWGEELEETKNILATSLSPLDIAQRSHDPYNLLLPPTFTNLAALAMGQGQKMFSPGPGGFQVVFVQSRLPLDSYQQCEAWLQAIQKTIGQLRAQKTEWQAASLRYTGRPVFVNEIAAGMQRDFSGSIVGTAAIIALLFWLAHRRWLPMFWLLLLLLVILVATLALGGLVLGTVSVMSLGFAAVLLGLAVDYAVVHYQEALAHPTLSVPEIRRAIAPSILWAAITTISAFLILNLGGLPGLGQLGTLVGLGIALAALIMVMVFLPPLFPGRRQPTTPLPPAPWWSYFVPQQAEAPQDLHTAHASYRRQALRLTAAVTLAALALLLFNHPGLDRSGDALKPFQSEAEAALQEITVEMGFPHNVYWLLTQGKNEQTVGEQLDAGEKILQEAVARQLVRGVLIPTALWPRPEFQAQNRPLAAALAQNGPAMLDRAKREGFADQATLLSERLLHTWAQAAHAPGVIWPTNQTSQWLLKRFVARAGDEWCALGLVYPATNNVPTERLLQLSDRLQQHRVLLSGWGLLGAATLQRVQARLAWLVLPMVALVLLSLWMAFRSWSEILFGLGVLALSGVCLLAVMGLAGWSWNLLNLMGLPLILGTGVDYSIFVQLALRRHGGDVRLVRQSVGRALLLCGGTAIAGFSSLAFSNNLGMASLGKICAVGIGANMLIAVFLLPGWWLGWRAKKLPAHPPHAAPPSTLYQAKLWRLGLVLGRHVPAWLINAACVAAADLFFCLAKKRREIVIENLLPVVGGRPAARQTARRLYRNFALKLASIWRFESGVPPACPVTDAEERKLIAAAAARGHGVLFITLHLGTWEFGSLALTDLGLKLMVLTLAEPGAEFTQMRTAARARWGVETLIIGQDGFSFVEAIKWLQAGSAAAISIDRPPARRGTELEFFGRPFLATTAAADLARATGCALVGVLVTHEKSGYRVKTLPEIQYDRREIDSPEKRRQLVQKILTAFEPEIRRHADQWYNFTPIWTEATKPQNHPFPP